MRLGEGFLSFYESYEKVIVTFPFTHSFVRVQTAPCCTWQSQVKKFLLFLGCPPCNKILGGMSFKYYSSQYFLSTQFYICILFIRNPKEQDGEVLPMGSLVEMLSTENPDNDENEVNCITLFCLYLYVFVNVWFTSFCIHACVYNL